MRMRAIATTVKATTSVGIERQQQQQQQMASSLLVMMLNSFYLL